MKRQKRDEKRIAPRLQVSVYVETFRETFPLGTLGNISMQGMFIRTTEPKEVGTSLDIRFQLPGDEQWIHLKAQVIRVNYPPSFSRDEPYVPRSRPVDDNPGMGLKILSVAPEGMAALKAFVRSPKNDS